MVRSVRGLLVVLAVAAGCRRDSPPPPAPLVDSSVPAVTTATPAELDAGPESKSAPDADAAPDTEPAETRDPLVEAVAALEDAQPDVRVLDVDVTIRSAKVTPKDALLDPMATLAPERWRFRACGRLVADAGATPDVVVVRVGEGGEPLKASAAPGTLGECLGRAARAVAFPEPDGGLATVEITLVWTRPGRP